MSVWKCFSLPPGGGENPLQLPVVLGRAPQAALLESRKGWRAQSIAHKYLSRAHCTFEENPASGGVLVTQLGKNPMFMSPQATALKAGQTTVVQDPSTEVSFFFPKELGLPKILLRKETIVQAPAPAAPIGGGSLVFKVSNEEDEDSVPEPTRVMPQKTTLLDAAMIESSKKQTEDIQAPPVVPRTLEAAPQAPAQEQPLPAPSVTPTPAPITSSTANGWGFSEAEILGQKKETTSKPEASPSSAPLPSSVQPQVAPPAPPTPQVQAPPAPPQQEQQPGNSTTNAPKPMKIGWWEWKSNVYGDDDNPKNWKRYLKATADVLENAYRDTSKTTIKIDDTYYVCFNDAQHGMVQYRGDDPSRWRSVRRKGGDPVDRSNVKRIKVIPESETDTDDDDYSDSDSEDDDDDDDSFASESSSDAGEKRKRAQQKKKNKK